MGSYIWCSQGQSCIISVTHFKIAKDTLSMKTEAMYYDKKGQGNVSMQRSFFKTTEINYVFFYSFQNFCRSKPQRRKQGTRGKTIFIEYSLTGA